jgi:hypothetical protein
MQTLSTIPTQNRIRSHQFRLNNLRSQLISKNLYECTSSSSENVVVTNFRNVRPDNVSFSQRSK